MAGMGHDLRPMTTCFERVPLGSRRAGGCLTASTNEARRVVAHPRSEHAPARLRLPEREHPLAVKPEPHDLRKPLGTPRRTLGQVWRCVAKRGLDLVGATLGLTILGPLLIVVAILIAATSGGPIFYSQERVGQGGRRFRIWKFRSMRNDAECATGPIWATEHDDRCTGIGRWLRRTNIDELPQLFNVLRGEMSLVGPRPERPVFVDQFRGEFRRYDARHAVPVGMTGWAQVHGWRGRTSLRKRLQYDLDYARRSSFGMDIRVLFMTVQHVVWGKTRWTGRLKRASRTRVPR